MYMLPMSLTASAVCVMPMQGFMLPDRVPSVNGWRLMGESVR